MSAKDWISLTISVSAFAISTLTAYYTTFSARSDLTVIADHPFPSFAFHDGKLVSFSERHTLTFVNSGNRPAAVTNMGLSLKQVRSLQRTVEDCLDLTGVVMSRTASPAEASFSPMVVKPAEINVVTVEFRWSDSDRSFVVRRGDSGPPSIVESDAGGKMAVHVCLNIEIASPGQPVRTLSKTIASGTWETRGVNAGGGEYTSGPFEERPIPLVRERSFSF